MNQAPIVAILPSPGMGHLIPAVELAKRLSLRHHLSVTFIVPTIGTEPPAQKALLQALSPATYINYVSLPEVDFQDLPLGVPNEVKTFLAISRSIPFLRDVLKSLAGDKSRHVYLVVDLFGTDAFDVAVELEIKPYVFFSTCVTGLPLLLDFPKFHNMGGMPNPAPIRGTKSLSIWKSDLPISFQDEKSNAYKLFLHHCDRYRSAEGFIVNTFYELEGDAIKFLAEDDNDLKCPPLYPIGPLVNQQSLQSCHGSSDGSGCLKWLDDQPHGSVLFVSFGSGGTISTDQMNELALGLELSNKRFIWVVRTPDDEASDGALFHKAQTQKDPLKSLPQGFLDRTKDLGLVVPNWAPQAQILSHSSTAGFVTHCGWNSILESIVHGVPLIAWPLYAEQKMNAVILEEGLNIALRPKTNETGLVVAEEVGKAVNDLLDGEEGKRLRKRMNDLKNAAATAAGEDGSLTKSFSQLVLKWKTGNQNGTTGYSE